MEREQQTHLTPSQAADVLHYIHDAENQAERKNGHKGQIPLGLAAIHAMRATVEAPDGKQQPMLTGPEMVSALEHVELEDERRRNYSRHMETPPRTNADRDYAERAAGEDFDKE